MDETFARLAIIFVIFAAIMFGSLFLLVGQRSDKKRRKKSNKQLANSPNNQQLATSEQDDSMPDLDSFMHNYEQEPASYKSSNKIVQANARVAVKLHTGETVTAKEILSVLRDERDGRMMVLMEDRAYRTLIDSPTVRKEFVQTMKQLSDSINQPDESPDVDDVAQLADLFGDDNMETDVAPSPPPVKSQPAQSPPPLAPPPPPVSPPLPPSKATEPSGEIPGLLPSYSLDDYQGKPVGKDRLGRVKVDYEPIPELNIPKAIEEFLQHKLQSAPQYQGREIHVLAAPSGGVRIQVDEDFFESVDEVADTEIRDYLKATIEEWQSHH